ncbi:MAG: hypothetical protein QOF51_1497 [Chloroflexota bacterium]|nr:hypothetical protein [Chloroflexota bacterium]
MSRPLTPEALVYDVPAASDPQLAPDGARVLYTVTTIDRTTHKVTSQLWFCDDTGANARPITAAEAKNGNGRWSPDGACIAFVSDRDKGSGIYLLPVEGPGEARQLTHHAQEIAELAWSPDGGRIAYVTTVDPANPAEVERPTDAPPPVRVTRRIDYKQDGRGYLGDTRRQLFVVEVASGERRQLTHEPQDHQGPQWSPDGGSVAVHVPNRNGCFSQLGLVDLATGDVRLVTPRDGVVGCFAWSPNGDRILFAGDRRTAGQLDFFLYEAASGATRRLTDDLAPWPEAGQYGAAPPSSPCWIDDHQALFHGIRAGTSGLYLLDTSTGAVELLHDWRALNSGLSMDAAGRRVVQGYASLERFGEVALYDREHTEARVITNQSAALLAEAPPARWERLDVTRGDMTIEVWLLRPPDFDSTKRYPVVLDVHGGPHGFYGYGFNAIQQCLATNGLLVVYANPRGSASYGRDFAEAVLGDWGGEDFADILAVVDATTQRPEVDAERIGIFGYSYGGYMTAWALSDSDRFRAAVCGAPAYDLPSLYGTSDISHVFGELEWGGSPEERRAWYAARSPSTFASRIHTPTLLIHGEADERCPIGQTEQLFVALLKAGCEVEYARYPGGSHSFIRTGNPLHRADVLARILAWFKTHLGEPA